MHSRGHYRKRRPLNPYSLIPDTILDVLRTAKRPLYSTEIAERVSDRLGDKVSNLEWENIKGRVSGNLFHMTLRGETKRRKAKPRFFCDGRGMYAQHVFYVG